MIIFPNCKINLGLMITGKREDGYHDIETVFYPVPLKDVVEFLPAHRPSASTPCEAANVLRGDDVIFSSSGIILNGPETDNLCIKTYHLLKQDFPDLPPLRIHLHKAIPAGAGLGGGSADAAFLLANLNKRFALGLGIEKLMDYALQLGSDCPFFLVNKPSLATGRGEKLVPVEVDLSPYRMVLVNPGIHINTGWAFGQLKKPLIKAAVMPHTLKTLATIIAQPPETWKDELVNDFEEPVFNQYPAVKEVKDSLYNGGALFASMSGSGSSVYGLFHKNHQPSLVIPPGYFQMNILL